jgi:hypothetical protein
VVRWPRGQECAEEIDAIAPVICEAFDQPSGLQIVRHIPERLEREAPPLQRPRMQNVAAAAGKLAADLDLLDAAISARNRQRSCRRWRQARRKHS